MSGRKKAFTLAELLVVVVIIGVLASVAVPKFRRVLETRKTTEAEEMMAAIRTEQEKRCVFGKNYTMDKNQIPVLTQAGLGQGSNSRNYEFGLEPAGVSAKSKGAAYTLQMLYKTGQMCCDGEGCASLNKNYPPCNESVENDECAAQQIDPCDGFTPQTELRPRECGCGGTQQCQATSSCNDGVISWVETNCGACIGGECECEDDQVSKEPCGCGGFKTITKPCENGKWGNTEETECDHPFECTDGAVDTENDVPCGCNGVLTKTRTCVDGCWGGWVDGECSAPAECSCSDDHEEGFMEGVECDDANKCGSGAVTWHCGANTNWEWRGIYDYSACIEKPEDRVIPCPNDDKHNQSISYECVDGSWTEVVDDSTCEKSQYCSAWDGAIDHCAALRMEVAGARRYNSRNPDYCCIACETTGRIWYGKEKQCVRLDKISSNVYALKMIPYESTNSLGISVNESMTIGTYSLSYHVASSGSAYGVGGSSGYGGSGGYGGYGGSGAAGTPCVGFTISAQDAGASECTNNFCQNLSDVGKKCYKDSWTTIVTPSLVSTDQPPNDRSGEECTLCNKKGTLTCSYQHVYQGSGVPAEAVCNELPEGSVYVWHTGQYLCNCNANSSCVETSSSVGGSQQNVYATRGLKRAPVYECQMVL